ncbi:hypothetical protein BDN72DRAFT_851767 [Pluteus cervinus]|uniref:Uncharacterized protein n=1 Tax=Pluteus cervinus TaxID=181527 RepID=A0ACD2ZY82_9AGAR|nr:hypothetical protein BDN72DRAFT_851767 [Pluteus cervinus]
MDGSALSTHFSGLARSERGRNKACITSSRSRLSAVAICMHWTSQLRLWDPRRHLVFLLSPLFEFMSSIRSSLLDATIFAVPFTVTIDWQTNIDDASRKPRAEATSNP